MYDWGAKSASEPESLYRLPHQTRVRLLLNMQNDYERERLFGVLRRCTLNCALRETLTRQDFLKVLVGFRHGVGELSKIRKLLEEFDVETNSAAVHVLNSMIYGELTEIQGIPEGMTEDSVMQINKRRALLQFIGTRATDQDYLRRIWMVFPSLALPCNRFIDISIPFSDSEWKPLQVIECMEVPESWSRVYILGCFDRRVTVYSQQVRALNLIRALFDCNRLSRKSKVGVIGGGMAGVTAAVAAARKDCTVTLFDQHECALFLQRNSSHRHLDPNLYEWPQPDQRGLPFLHWPAGYADEVTNGLRTEFNQSSVTFKNKTRITGLNIAHDAIEVFGDHPGTAEKFDCVIIAIGYGIEPLGEYGTPPYWSNDSLAGPFRRRQRVLVSGSGDGGLIDLARATLWTNNSHYTFSHSEIMSRFANNPAFLELGKSMKEIDRRKAGEGKTTRLYQDYDLELHVPDSLKTDLIDLKRSDTIVTFNYRSLGVFSVHSALINRLIAFLIIKTELVECVSGDAKLESSLPGTLLRRVGFGNSDIREFDNVIFRHGPPPKFLESTFPSLAAGGYCLRNRAALDLTRHLADSTKMWFA